MYVCISILDPNAMTAVNPDQNIPKYKTACGGFIKGPSRYPSALFHGEQVFFCTKACLKAFLENPEPFMAGEIEHPPEDA